MKALLTFEDKWNDYSALNEQDIDNICNEFGYPNLLISNKRVVTGGECEGSIGKIDLSKSYLKYWKTNGEEVRIYLPLRNRRNLNRKSKSHFRKL